MVERPGVRAQGRQRHRPRRAEHVQRGVRRRRARPARSRPSSSSPNVRINHFVVIDFNGFQKMVDALGGVEVCVPAGGQRHHRAHHAARRAPTTSRASGPSTTCGCGTTSRDNGDIGRMKRQQTFLASMANKAVSAGTLANPVRLCKFLDAATKSLTTDTGLASLNKLAALAKSLQGHRPRPDPVPDRAVRDLRAGPEPAAVGARRPTGCGTASATTCRSTSGSPAR